MLVSEARIAANRRNAQLSTGPKTPEGKERSRVNGLKHGLCAAVVVPESPELVQQSALDFYNTLRPQNEFHSWLVDRCALLSIRIDRAERMERRLRDRRSLLAEVGWEDDRRADAEALGAVLSARPAEVVEALRRTPQGCEWLMSRWAMLAYCADINKGWTPEQARLAFDLLATPPEFRNGHKPGVSLDFDGKPGDTGDDPAAVARRQVAELKERREAVLAIDEVDRSLAEADLSDEANPELKRLRRYEGSLISHLKWCLGQIRYESPHKIPGAKLRPRWLPKPEVELIPPGPGTPSERMALLPGTLPNPPFDLTDDEVPPPGQPYDIPLILENRRRKEAKRAEGRRESRRREVKKLRA